MLKSSVFPLVVGAFEVALALAGLVLLWRLGLSKAARTERPSSRLAAWEAPPTSFLSFLLLVMGGSFFAVTVATMVGRLGEVRGDALTVLSGAAAQFGMLAGVALFRFGERRTLGFSATQLSGIGTSGLATFLVALPVLVATGNLWELLLEQFGLPTGQQDLIKMFAQADSPALLGTMIVLAVVVAPLTEELVFRAGLFRYLRTRLPRWLALVLPAVLFALLHVNWQTLQGLVSVAPLVVLAILFSLAYERTGQIGTPIVAHACFNLNTVVIILSGLAT
ncbi:MAG: CPBP family intramembrane metalloprotease [Verrucomicrobia bacterium]|nr:CPBP family intramembrane metalloprotease [Verrucomicrobiota bacterium]